jgi:hypothetical protein
MADQCVTSLHPVTKANIGPGISFPPRDASDIRETKNMFRLTPEQTEALPTLPRGQAIVDIPRLADRHLVQVVHIPPAYITDEEIDELNAKDKVLQNLLAQVQPPDPKPQPMITDKDLEDVHKLLGEVAKNQYVYPKTKMFKNAGFALGGKAQDIAAYCLKNHFIKILKPGILKGKPQFLVLDDKGYERLNIPKKRYHGHGAGELHVLFQIQIKIKFARFHPELEYYLGDQIKKFIDVAIIIKRKL